MSENLELFESLEQEYTALSISISRKLNVSIPEQFGEVQKASIQATGRELEEAGEIIGQMEMELFNLPQNLRTRHQVRLKNYRNELGTLKKCLTRMSPPANEQTKLLSGHVTLDLDSTSMDQKTRLLNDTARLTDFSHQLQESHGVALETGILSGLGGQREPTQHPRYTPFERNTWTCRALKTYNRLSANRCFNAAIIIVLIMIIGFIANKI
ncbi:t-SNARE VTI1 [Basidiobolus ranarum]|uniref:t-SNARE VTI1 n=1 Tax=Basidiobolus ranarum TaxID=34480 RepID=A0ABR2VY70_9FUNG